MPSSTTGTLMRKTEPHQKCASSAPPVMGPSAMAMPVAPAQIAIARPRSAGSKTLLMMDSVLGSTAAPPMPIRARPAISQPGDGEKADIAEATPKMARPSTRNRLRP